MYLGSSQHALARARSAVVLINWMLRLNSPSGLPRTDD
jgi:hypothetical protein